jgi:hypothetical protein
MVYTLHDPNWLPEGVVTCAFRLHLWPRAVSETFVTAHLQHNMLKLLFQYLG